MRTHKVVRTVISVLAFGGWGCVHAFVTPAPGPFIPPPTEVAGKDYSDNQDRDQAAMADPLQNLHTNGAGGVQDGFDYSGQFFMGGSPIADPDTNVDALSHRQDALFDAAISNQAALLISVQGDPTAPVYSHAIDGTADVWATSVQLNAAGVTDLDGLDVWGPETRDDAELFSLEGDPLGVAVWGFTNPDGVNQASGPIIPIFTTNQLAMALGQDPTMVGGLDLDGLIARSGRYLFSVAPNPLLGYDGGEIWYWDGANPAQFLVHGGITWDTTNNVTALFGAENIDALETIATIPLPAPVGLLGLGLAGFFAYVARRKTRRT